MRIEDIEVDEDHVHLYIQKHAEKGLEPAQGELFPRSR
jgi:hypothetical protein